MTNLLHLLRANIVPKYGLLVDSKCPCHVDARIEKKMPQSWSKDPSANLVNIPPHSKSPIAPAPLIPGASRREARLKRSASQPPQFAIQFSVDLPRQPASKEMSNPTVLAADSDPVAHHQAPPKRVRRACDYCRRKRVSETTRNVASVLNVDDYSLSAPLTSGHA